MWRERLGGVCCLIGVAVCFWMKLLKLKKSDKLTDKLQVDMQWGITDITTLLFTIFWFCALDSSVVSLKPLRPKKEVFLSSDMDAQISGEAKHKRLQTNYTELHWRFSNFICLSMFILSFAHRIQPPKEALQKSSKKYQPFPLSNPKPNHGRRGNQRHDFHLLSPLPERSATFFLGATCPSWSAWNLRMRSWSSTFFWGGCF